jgi:hypothetical protein
MPTFWAIIIDEKVSRKEIRKIPHIPLRACINVDWPKILDREHSIEKRDVAFMAFGLVNFVDYRLGWLKIQ